VKVLIVDDQEDARMILRAGLEASGATVADAENGHVALQMARAAPPDILVTDIMMPTMDGYALCRAWKADPWLKSIPVVFYTATYTDREDKKFAFDLGADAFITKPIEMDDLLTQLKQVISSHATGKLAVRWEAALPETVLLREYNQVLVNKLERKMIQLEESERRLVMNEQELQSSLSKYQTLFESSRDALLILAPPLWKFTAANPATLQLFGASSVAELTLLGPQDISREFQPDGRPSSEKAQEVIETAMREGSNLFEWEIRRLDGRLFIAEVMLTRMQLGEERFLQASIRDITERKRAETALIKSNRALAALSAVNHSLVHSRDEGELLSAVCRAIVKQHSYRMAWVGYLEHDAEKSIRPVAHDGIENGYLESAAITWADNERGQGPTGRAARTGQTQVSQDLLKDERMLPWLAAATERGYAASISLPLIDNGDVFGALTIYSDYADAFNPAEVSLLEELAEDLAYGIFSLRTRKERDAAQLKIGEQLTKLEANLEDTIQAIAAMVELRDPYTAGHERRVAELAVAIAKEMGLPTEQVHGIHLAGEVHDLGKITIPAEILSKPARLNEIEYNLIKTHPQAGYDILKNIDFTWPIAQMVYQHHERIDGSGYPQGLKSDAILLEARILCVADVVEAMSSHRPYRPGLGIEVALDEIRRGRATIYDPAVVDACLKIFAEGKFKLS